MGEVYRATDTKLARQVAIKVLPEAFAQDAERLTRFDREAKTLAALNHPGIAAIYGLEEADGSKALVMELVEGPTLADRIAQGPIPVDDALPIARQIAEALEAAHEQGIIHRDLKPANIKVRQDGLVKVLDFGVAKALSRPKSDADVSDAATATVHATRLGAVVGTAAYMSPEQARGQVVDPRSDIFSFGVVLYELVTGQRPFAGDSTVDVLMAVLQDEPPPADVPEPIAAVLRKCLAKQATARFASMAHVKAALGRAPGESQHKPREKPSIAVLPFTNMSGDPNQEYFSDGVVEEIITALSHFRQLSVIARNSTFTYRGRSVDVRQVSRELGVRYVLQGSVRKVGDRVRITSQLVDATDGSHLWADRFDGLLEDIFDLQDRVAARVVGAVEPTLRQSEIERSRRKRPENLAAYDLYLRALPHAYAFRVEDNLRALDLLHESVALDADFAPALAHLAWCYEQRLFRGWPTVQDGDAEQAVSFARRAIEADRSDAHAMVLGGFVLVMVNREYENGIAIVQRGLELNPSDVLLGAWGGWAHCIGGDLDIAERSFTKALDLSPVDPLAYIMRTGVAWTQLLDGRYEDAVKTAQKAAAQYADWDITYWLLAAGNAYVGRDDEARAATTRLRSLHPGLTISRLAQFFHCREDRRKQIILEGLRKAGLEP